MPATQFSERFLSSLPSGVSPEDVHVISCAAVAVPVTELNPEEKLVVSSFTKAGPDSMVNENGNPTVMRVQAWMCHEGFNRNNQGFVKEELEIAAKGLFAAPNFGVMDFNHSAVMPWSDEPKVIGLWYKAEFAFDQKAEKWGILATGMLWSWLFPEHADKLLADQARRGHMRFSMAAIAGSTELVTLAEGKHGAILHNPIFFTVSALDVPPADAHASGVGSEDTEDDDDTIRQRLAQVAALHPWSAASIKQEDRMNDSEVIKQLTEDRIAAETALKAFEEAAKTDAQKLATEVANLTEKVEKAAITISELETVREGLVADKETAAVRIAELEAQVAELETFKNEVESAKAAAARAELSAARVAELPETIRLIHSKKDEAIRTRIEDKWVAMSDEEWSDYKELMQYVPETKAPMKVSFLDRSRTAAEILNLSTDTEDTDDLSTRAKSLLR